MDFNVWFTKTGLHYVWIRGFAAGPLDDSLHLGLDGAPTSSSERIGGGTYNSWTWSQYTITGTVVATINVLTPGFHTLTVYMREDGFIVDKLLLTLDGSFVPSATGPSESPLEPIPTSATNIFYVATNGNDSNPGTANSPWRTPGPSSRKLRPGDTLIIRAGRYVLSTDSDMLEPPSGETNAWITVQGENGTMLVGRNNLHAAINLVLNQSYLRFENLDITHDAQASDIRFNDGIDIHGGTPSNIVLVGINVHHVDDLGLTMQAVRFVTVMNCVFAFCADGAIGSPPGSDWRYVKVIDCQLSNSGHYFQGGSGPNPSYDRPDGFGIEYSTGPVELRRVISEHNLGDGLDSKAANTAIIDCIAANNHGDGIKLWEAPSGVTNSLVYGRGDGDPTHTGWVPIVIKGSPANSDFSLVNVTVHDPLGSSYVLACAYDDPSLTLNLVIRNCTFYGSNSPLWINGATTLTVEHSLFYIPTRPDQVLVHGGNTYSSTTLANLGLGNIYGDPVFIAPAWGNTGNYHLHSNSPAVDLGTSTGAPADDLDGHFRDCQPDAGAYECVACAAPTLLGLSFGTNVVQFLASTKSGKHYGVQRAPSLVGPWSQIGSIIGTGSQVRFEDNAPFATVGFYRIVALCP
jgi:hypothetical protein